MQSAYEVVQVIPQWAMVHLGKTVVFLKDYDFYGNGACVHEAGTIGILDGVQQGSDGVEALILSPHNEGCILNPTFDHIAPI